MRLAGRLLAAAAALILAGGVAQAANPSSFSGAYLGTYVGADPFVGTVLVGTRSGYNFSTGPLLLGVEVDTQHLAHLGTNVDARLVARTGVVLGDRLALYGIAGIGSKVSIPVVSVGFGGEIMLTPSLSAFLEAEQSYVYGYGFSQPFGMELHLGVNYHPGRSSTMVPADSPFEGAYMGTQVGYLTRPFSDGWQFGVHAGYNLMAGNFVFGLEVETTHDTFPDASMTAVLSARGGGVLGSRVLTYGKAGIGTYFSYYPIWAVGGGAEIALGDRLSVFGEATATMLLGAMDYLGLTVTGGMNFHFGR